MPNPDQPEESSEEPSEAERRRERTVKIARRAGYVVFFGGGLVLFITLVVGVVQGITNNRVWDPYTGEPYYGAQCLSDARELIQDSTDYERVVPPWENRYHRWVTRCKKKHPTVFQLLVQTRESIREPDDTEGPEEAHSSEAGSTSEN